MTSFSSRFTKPSFPDLGLVRFPAITVSPEERTTLGITHGADNREVLKQLAQNGYKALRAKGRFEGIDEATVQAQFDTEFTTFDKTGVHDYLLLVWDINRWADQQGIVRGWGRGSAGGSITLYSLGITRVNPITHKLNFPRFISEARMKPVVKDGVIYVDGKTAPDIDVDYQYGRRAEVVKYIETKHAGRTCKISTRLELTGKMALKNTLKVYARYGDEDAQRVSDMVEAKFGKVQSLHEARTNPDMKKWLASNPRNEKIYSIATAIEGLVVAKGQHPSGVFISYNLLDGNIPTEQSKSGDMVTSYDMETVAGLGIKVDILGVRTLDLVDGTARIAGVSVDDIDVNHPSIYDYIANEDTYAGLFQIEDGTTKGAARHIRPRNVDDLAAVLAISRPGAFKYIDQFADYIKTGTIKPFYPAIDEVLKSTGGALIMQEQITAVCRDVFGLSDIDADQVRYAIGKKKREEMVKWEEPVFRKGRERGIPEDVIKAFWATCSASADYQFCLAHAVEYAYLTAATVFYKAAYPQAFYLSMLKLASEEPNPIVYMNGVISEMRKVGIALLPPDLIKSGADFGIDEGSVRFGLSHVKGVSETTMAKVASFRREFKHKFEIFEAAKAAGVNIGVLVGLIYCGCLDSILGGSVRTKLAFEAQLYNLLTDNERKLVDKLAKEMNEDLITILRDLPNRKNEKGKALIRESRLDTLRKRQQPYWDMFKANSKNEKLCAYMMERHYLGFSYTTSLNTVFSEKVQGLTPIADLKAPPPREDGDPWPDPQKFVGFVGETKSSVSAKTGKPYYKMDISDDTGNVRVMVFGQDRLAACRSFNGRLPEEKDLVIVTGNLTGDGGIVFAQSCLVQPPLIQMKRSDAAATI